jgi:hypothetical protein
MGACVVRRSAFGLRRERGELVHSGVRQVDPAVMLGAKRFLVAGERLGRQFEALGGAATDDQRES